MANQPISGLTAGVPVTDPNLFANVQAVNAGPVKTTALELKTYIGNNLTLTGTPILPQTFTIGTVSYTWPSANGPIGSVLTNSGVGVLTWQMPTGITSVSLDASPVGLTVSGSPVTSSGSLVITGGVLNVANGGTGAATPTGALINLLPATAPTTAGYALFNDGAGNFYWAAAGGGGGGGGGGVSTFSGGTTGLTPVGASTGNIVLGGTLAVANGGTGVTSLPALQALVLPAQGGNAGRVLGTNGTAASWVSVGGTGTVTSVSLDPGTTGLTVNGGTAPVTITGSGSFALAGVLSPANGGTGLSALGSGVQTALGFGVNTNGGLLTGGASGILPIARGGTGTASVPAQGQLLIGNGTGYTVTTLTQGPGITITNGPGTILISATGGGGGGTGTVTQVTTTLSGINIATNTTTPAISGTLGAASGGTGVDASAAASGQILIGNGTGFTLATLTAGTGVTITDAPGSITIDATGTAGVSTISFGSTGLTPNSASSGAITVGGTLALGSGGTGLTTIGVAGTTLVSNGTALAYGNPNAAVNIVGGTTGQVPYQSGASTTLFAGPGAAGTYLGGNGIAAPTFKVAQTTLGSTVLSLNTTTTALAGMTGITMTPTYTPSATKDVATKDYVDANVSAVSRLAPVACVAVTDFPPTGGGTIDGVTLTNGMRVLLVNNTLGATNGVWTVNTGGAWTRPTDANDWAEYVSASVFVTNGTSYANTSWIQTAPAGGTIDVTAQVWAQQSGIYNYVAGTGISIAGTTINNTGVLSFAGGTTGLTPAASTTGAITLAGTLNIANGGTSATTAQGARTNILPAQAGQNGKFLQTNGTDVVWATSSGGAVYYIALSAGGVLQTLISAAGYTDAVGNSYVLYNSTASNITITAASFPNAASFPDCSATSITIGAGKTMMVSTQVLTAPGTYFIDASNYLSGGVFVTSVAGSATMAAVLAAIPVIDNEGNVYVITNTGTSDAVISSITVDNSGAYPGYTSTTSFSIPAGGTATVVSTTASTNYVVEAITNSVSKNITGGTPGQLVYQSAANTTAFLGNGTQGQFLVSDGAGNVPIWTTVPKVGAYPVTITAGGTVQSALTTAPNGEVQYAAYTIYNNSAATQTLTNASGWSNGSSWPGNVSGNNLLIAPYQSVTISVTTVGTTYSIISSSSPFVTATTSATAGGTIASALTTGNVIEKPGMLVTIRNAAAASALITLTGTLTNFQPFAPAASATGVIIQNGECVTLRVVTPGSAYDVINLTTQNVALNLNSSPYNLDMQSQTGGMVAGDILTITNTLTLGNLRLDAVTIDNYQSYPVQATATRFIVPKDGTVSLQLMNGNDQWKIVSFEYPGLQAGAVAFSARTNGSISVGTSTAYPGVVLKLPTIDFNPQNYYDATTGRFQPLVAGYYQVNTLLNSVGNGNASANSLLYKNGAIVAYGPGFATTNAGTSTISTVVYMNGTTDYLEFAAFASVAWTPQQNGALFSASLVTQQNIINTTSGIYNVPLTSADNNLTVPAILAANGITEVVNDLYVITNTETSANVTITATSFIGYEAYPSQTTSTSIVLTPGATLELQNVTIGTGYQIVILNTPINVGSVAFAIGNGQGSAATLGTSKTIDGILLWPVATYGSYDTVSYVNPQNYLNPTTGVFNPKTAGYYQINACITQNSGNTTPAMGVAIVKNWASASPEVLASTADYVATSGGVVQGSNVSSVVYMNGTTDTLCIGLNITTGVWSPSIWPNSINFSGFLTNQTLTEVVGTTAAAYVGKTATQAIPTAAVTKVTFATPTSEADPQSWWNAANNRFIPTIPGYYQVSLTVGMQSVSGGEINAIIYKNGSQPLYVSRFSQFAGTVAQFPTPEAVGLVYMNGTTDYLEGFVFQSSGVSANTYGSSNNVNFGISLVGANQAIPAVKETTSAITIGPAATPANGTDYCIVQIDNIKAWFRQTGGNAGLTLSTVSGSMSVIGDYTAIQYGGGAGWQSIPFNGANPFTLTTTANVWVSIGTAGRFEAIIREVGGAGRVYRINYTINFAYINSSVIIDRIVG